MVGGMDNETRLWQGWITATQALSAHTHTYLYMMFPLSRAFILPHCPFSKASCKGSKGQLSPIVKVLFPCSTKFGTDCPQIWSQPQTVNGTCSLVMFWPCSQKGFSPVGIQTMPTLAAATALLTSSAEDAATLQIT